VGVEFDWIVVGGGSAGCALAGRLSEDLSLEVALVEAGPDVSDEIFEVPGLFWQQQKSSFDWDFLSEPERGLDGRRAYLPRGRALGGSSAMNTMLYVRGAASDYDDWAAAGCEGWGYDEVLPLFRRSEDNSRGASELHGVGGPLSVVDVPEVPSLLGHWVAAAEEDGHPAATDFADPAPEGVGIYQATQRGGRRCSSADAFIAPNRGRPNLTVFSSTQALRVVFDGSRAVGVEVEAAGTRRVLWAGREIALCAGAYLSPQLLMLSGVGPAGHLREMGIEVLVDNPEVGANLQDHPGCFMTYLAEIGKDCDERSWTEAGGFVRSDPGLDRPDLQFHAAVGSFGDDGVPTTGMKAISYGPYVCRPHSHGEVRLRSGLPQAKPRIWHNFLTDARDVAVLREGVRMAMRIARRPSLAELLRPERESVAAGLIPASDRDAGIDAYIRATAFSFYHPIGTCAIGAVVDPSLAVRGVEGLRVCDASVMPRLIAGNTNAPAIMIGEKLASLVGYRRAVTPDRASLPGSLDDRQPTGPLSGKGRGNPSYGEDQDRC
jgi:choline dehydrogenase-like flavoprotein